MAKFQGVVFLPYRTFREEEKKMDLYHITKHFNLSWDYDLGMFDAPVGGHPVKFAYNHDAFYKAMGKDDWADIYYCEKTGKYYIPCTRTVMYITRNIAQKGEHYGINVQSKLSV